MSEDYDMDDIKKRACVSDINTPAKSLDCCYEFLDYPRQKTTMDATPSGGLPDSVKQVNGFPAGPKGGKKVAGLGIQPLGPARTYNDRAWKPKGRS